MGRKHKHKPLPPMDQETVQRGGPAMLIVVWAAIPLALLVYVLIKTFPW